MRSVCIVPIKTNSERVAEKNFRVVADMPLYQYILLTLSKTNFDEICVDTDSKVVKTFAQNLGYSVIDRLPHLASNNANGNDLLNYHRTCISADLYFQAFVTAPLLKHESINECLHFLSFTNEFDSIFTVNKIYSWFWFDGRPVNYDPKTLPRSQDAVPIIKETTGLYGITAEALDKYKCRIGAKPYLFEVSELESIDLDTEQDFMVLESLAGNKGNR